MKWILLLLFLSCLLSLLLLLHKVTGLEEKLDNAKPIYHVTTEFVVINPCKDNFDVAEFSRR